MIHMALMDKQEDPKHNPSTNSKIERFIKEWSPYGLPTHFKDPTTLSMLIATAENNAPGNTCMAFSHAHHMSSASTSQVLRLLRIEGMVSLPDLGKHQNQSVYRNSINSRVIDNIEIKYQWIQDKYLKAMEDLSPLISKLDAAHAQSMYFRNERLFCYFMMLARYGVSTSDLASQFRISVGLATFKRNYLRKHGLLEEQPKNAYYARSEDVPKIAEQVFERYPSVKVVYAGLQNQKGIEKLEEWVARNRLRYELVKLVVAMSQAGLKVDVATELTGVSTTTIYRWYAKASKLGIKVPSRGSGRHGAELSRMKRYALLRKSNVPQNEAIRETGIDPKVAGLWERYR